MLHLRPLPPEPIFPFTKKINGNVTPERKWNCLVLHLANGNVSQLGIFIPKHHVPGILGREVGSLFKPSDTRYKPGLELECFQIFSARNGFRYRRLEK